MASSRERVMLAKVPNMAERVSVDRRIMRQKKKKALTPV